jgi:hypothetical protein
MTRQGEGAHHVGRNSLRLITGRAADFAELAAAGPPRTTHTAPLRHAPGSQTSEAGVAPPRRQQEGPAWT